jgi:hypothetical protein
MTVKLHRPGESRPGPAPPSGDTATAKKPVGRPKGEPSTIVNVRLPLLLVAQCVFRAKIATDSGRNLPPIPVEGCH